MSTPPDRTVLIIGAGPTGLMAALELSRFGIPVRLIDAAEAPAATSRAIGIQPRTLEQLQLRGLVDQFLRLGNQVRGGNIYGAGKRILSLDFTRIDSRYNFLLFLSQAETERILREALAGAGVSVEYGFRLTAFAQNPATGITATLQDKDGALHQVAAAALVDAEGAHSIVRTSLGLSFAGITLEHTYALGDLHLDGALSAQDFHIFSSEQGFIALFPLGGTHFRLIVSDPVLEPRSDTAPILAELQTLYDQRAHLPARLSDLAWSSWFHINSRMVEKLRVGRVFLAGDAAHIHSPAGAQGMNTGIEDSIDLGWKLALFLQGHASETLLDTYEQDRLPVMRSVLSRTERLTEVIGSGNPLVRAAFNHLAPLLGSSEFVQDNATAQMSQIALDYRSSPLSADHASGGSLHAGDRIPDLPLRAGGESTTLFQLLDPGRCTLLLVNSRGEAAPESAAAAQLGLWSELLHIVRADPPSSGEAARYHDLFGTLPKILLIRPDAYIGFRGGEHSWPRLVEYLQKWLSPPSARQTA